jgi:hypothetical protein
MAVNKNFVVKNGLEVKSNLLVADTSQDSVGIGTSYIKEKLHVIGGIGATSLFVGGIGTVHVSTGNTARYENVNITGVGTIATFKANAVDVANINVSAAVTANKFYGDGSTLTGVSVGVRTAGAVLGFGVTFLDIRGSGVSTAYFNSNVGIATLNFEGGGSGGSVSISSAAPSSPNNGDLWYSIDYGRTFVYYDENELGIGTATVWVDAAPFNAGGKYLGAYGATSYGAIGNTAGTKTVPSWHFNDDTNTGLFQGGTTDHLSFAAGGSGIATVNVGGLTVSGIVTSHSISVSGDATVAGNMNITGDLVYNEERAVNSLVSGTSTITNSNATRLNAGVSTFTDDVTFTGAAANVTWDKSTDDLIFNDNAQAKFGTGEASELGILSADGSETMAQFVQDEGVSLRHNNNIKLVTTTDGVVVTGVCTAGIVTATTLYGDGSNITGIAAGGSGQFNTGLTGATAYAVTTSMATALTANASSSYRTVIHSIHVANISASEVTVSGEMQASFSFAHTIPIPAGSAVELLKQPKVLGASETIELQASANSALQATIIAEQKEDTDLWDAQVDITSAATWTDLYTSASNPSVVQSILLANDDGTNDVKARVVWTDGSNNIQAYLCYDLMVPADSTVELCEQPKYLASGYKLRVYANQADRLEVTASGKQITS